MSRIRHIGEIQPRTEKGQAEDRNPHSLDCSRIAGTFPQKCINTRPFLRVSGQTVFSLPGASVIQELLTTSIFHCLFKTNLARPSAVLCSQTLCTAGPGGFRHLSCCPSCWKWHVVGKGTTSVVPIGRENLAAL